MIDFRDQYSELTDREFQELMKSACCNKDNETEEESKINDEWVEALLKKQS